MSAAPAAGARPRHLVVMAAGTGGHVIPGLAVAREMQRRGWTVSWLGTQRGLEQQLVPPSGIPLHALDFHGLRGKGTVPYREAMRVPLLLRLPGGARGAQTQALASHVDLAPTLLAAAGLPDDAVANELPVLAGRDLSPHAAKPADADPRAGQGDGILLHWTSLAAQDHDSLLAIDLARRSGGVTPLSFLQIDGGREVGVEIHSMSKGFNMIGWRMAFVAGHPKIVQAFADVKDNSDSGQFMAVQQAAKTALDPTTNMPARHVAEIRRKEFFGTAVHKP